MTKTVKTKKVQNYRKTEFADPVAGSADRNKKKKGFNRASNYSWTDVSIALGIDLRRMIEFFQMAGIVYYDYVGSNRVPRITTYTDFEDAGYGEMFMARLKNGAHFSQAVVFPEGIKFISKHYKKALLEISRNKNVSVSSVFKKHKLRMWHDI